MPNLSLTPLGRRFTLLAWVFVAAWTIIITVILIMRLSATRLETQDLARAQAQTLLELDQGLRLWASQHGGVYVPIDVRTPPNPYLAHIPERDITTPAGVHLTLMNPAYILRQFGQEFGARTGIENRITSLKPLNPINAPDEWERDALMQLERGARQVSGFVEKNRAPVLRMMRPMMTEEHCLKCHAFQGYQVGDGRGGVRDPDLLFRIVHPADRAQFAAHSARVRAEKLPGAIEFRILLPDQSERWIGHVCQPVFDATDKFLGTRGSNRDITERKQLEHELQTQRDFAMTVMDTMGQGLTVTDADSRFVYVNRAYAQMVGLPSEELIGKQPADATLAEDHMALARARAERHTGKTTSYETRFHRADGSIVTALITGVPRWVSGKVAGTIAVVTDLTAQKRVEEQLKFLSTHDALTGVYNRAFFETELARLGASHELPVSIIVADVDDMKINNDTRGHAAGDELLKRAARVFQAVFRASDIIARIGGDEFALILPGTDAPTAAGMITRVRENLAELNSHATDLELNLSLGVATARDSALEATFKIADARMYEDKRAHKS
ncbi:MAG: diguanylate cyclase [Chloroflexi bacterium]|nr:diguanylate cyclase [Chloroflexota bacterium]